MTVDDQTQARGVDQGIEYAQIAFAGDAEQVIDPLQQELLYQDPGAGAGVGHSCMLAVQDALRDRGLWGQGRDSSLGGGRS